MSARLLSTERFSVRNKYRRLRYEWNLFCIAIAIFALFFCYFLGREMLCEIVYYESECTHISYDGEILVTDSETFSVSSDDSIYMNNLSESLETGDKITVKVSKISGEVLEILSGGDTVYKFSDFAWPFILFVVIFLGALITVVVLAFYTVNAKKPRGPFAEIQEAIILK